MSNLTRWDPYREFRALSHAMERLFDNELSGQSQTAFETMDWDVAENDNEYIVSASLPGVKPDDIEITYNNQMLTIKAVTRDESEKEQARYHIRERRFGTFARSMALPTTVNADAIDANYENGILTLRLPKAEEVKPRRIAIKDGNSQSNRTQTIEARTQEHK